MARNKLLRSLRAVAAIGVLLVLFPKDVHAYLDPGTGSLVLQVIIAGILTVSLAIKIFWKKIKSGMARLFSARSSHPKSE